MNRTGPASAGYSETEANMEIHLKADIGFLASKRDGFQNVSRRGPLDRIMR